MEIIIDAAVGSDGRLIDYQLPSNTPVGPVKLIIQSPSQPKTSNSSVSREEARKRLLAIGRLTTVQYSPEGTIRSNQVEDRRLADLFADDSQAMLDLINLDRGPKE